MSRSVHRKFSYVIFVKEVALTVAVVFGIWALMLTDYGAQQLDWPHLIFLVAMCTHFVAAFVEFFFHRYVLHAPLLAYAMETILFPIPPLARVVKNGLLSLFEKHGNHHRLTFVGGAPHDQFRRRVTNAYPIEREHQHESSFFPWYALGAFMAVSTPFLLLVQLAWPKLPILFGGYIGITFSFVLYEVIHAIEHLPVMRLQSLFCQKYFGRMWRGCYSFHLRHHADVLSNESVSGFFGIPIPDLLFGTFQLPKTLFLNGEVVKVEEFNPPRPIGFIHWLDIHASTARSRYRSEYRGARSAA